VDGVCSATTSCGGTAPGDSGEPAADLTLLASRSAARAGDTVTMAVSLAGYMSVAGVQLDMRFEPSGLTVAAKENGKPDCTVNAAIDKGATSFAFRPSTCDGTPCLAVRALVLSVENTVPIATPAVLFTCRIDIPAAASPGAYTLQLSGAITATPNGNRAPGPALRNGSIIVRNEPNPVPAGLGNICSFDNHCESGFCTDGVCCATVLCAPDATCSLSGHSGQCNVRSLKGSACRADADCQSGYCSADGLCDAAPQPTPQPTRTRMPTRTVAPTLTAVPTPTPAPVKIIAATVESAAGSEAVLAVNLDTAGVPIAGVQNDLGFAASTRIAAKASGRPDCEANADLNKAASGFAFLPSGCSDAECTAVRVVIVATDNVDPIADGAELYRCRIVVAADAASGTYPVTVTHVIASSPAGAAVYGASGVDGAVAVHP
jgi:hypothetical protein